MEKLLASIAVRIHKKIFWDTSWFSKKSSDCSPKRLWSRAYYIDFLPSNNISPLDLTIITKEARYHNGLERKFGFTVKVSEGKVGQCRKCRPGPNQTIHCYRQKWKCKHSWARSDFRICARHIFLFSDRNKCLEISSDSSTYCLLFPVHGFSGDSNGSWSASIGKAQI